MWPDGPLENKGFEAESQVPEHPPRGHGDLEAPKAS